MKDKIASSSKIRFFETILKLKNIEECNSFFDDICTINEIKAITQRLEVAVLLEQGKTYLEIGKETGASTATISRVNKCLNYGSNGYKLALGRNEDTDKKGEI